MVASPVANAYAEVHAAKNRVELLLERLGRTAGEESSEPFGEYLERWLLLQQLRLAPSTHRAYRMTVDAYILPRLGDRPLRELSTRELNDVFIELARCGGQGGRSLAASTVRYVHRLIHKALEDAVREGALVINVATRSSPPRRDVEGRKIRNPPSFWSAEQLAEFFDAISGHHLEYLLYVMATTGVRRGEALGMRWSDVDIKRSALHLRRALTRAPDGALELGELKTCTPRRVVMPASTLCIVKLQRERQRLWQLCAGDAWDNNLDLVFTERDGAHLTPQRITHQFRRLVRRTALPTIRLHDLRHSHATILLEAGVSLHVVSKRLGHSTTFMTQSAYAHVGANEDYHVAAQFDDLLGRRL